MKTDQLIDFLSQGVEPVDRGALMRTIGLALAAGSAISLGLLVTVFGSGSMLPSYFVEPMFWVKIAFGATFASSSLWMATRLSRPGVRIAAAALLPLVPIAGLWLLAGPALASALPSERVALVMGRTVIQCLVGIPLLALPVLVGMMLTLRGMAPTRPSLAGAAAGAAAGGLGAVVYALQCPEFSAPFLGVWYVIGALIPAAAGALAGRVALRW